MTQQQKTTTALEVTKPFHDLRSFLEIPNRVQELTKLAPPSWDMKRLFGLVIHKASTDSKLLKCTPVSIYQALKDACAVGLEPCSPLQEAALIPFWNKRINQFEAKFCPMYKGLIAAARRTGVIKDAGAYIVFDGDVVDVDYGRADMIHHKPLLTRQHDKKVAVWSKFVLADGTVHYDPPILASEMAEIKRKIIARNGGPEKYFGGWVTDEAEMWKKTSIRRGAKLCQATQSEYTEKLNRAISFDEGEEDAEEVETTTIDAKAVTVSVGDAPADTTASKAKARVQKAREAKAVVQATPAQAESQTPQEPPAEVSQEAEPTAEELAAAAAAMEAEGGVVVEEDAPAEPAPAPAAPKTPPAAKGTRPLNTKAAAPAAVTTKSAPGDDRVTNVKKLAIGIDLLPAEQIAKRAESVFLLLNAEEQAEVLRDSMLEKYGDLKAAKPIKLREFIRNAVKLVEGE